MLNESGKTINESSNAGIDCFNFSYNLSKIELLYVTPSFIGFQCWKCAKIWTNQCIFFWNLFVWVIRAEFAMHFKCATCDCLFSQLL